MVRIFYILFIHIALPKIPVGRPTEKDSLEMVFFANIFGFEYFITFFLKHSILANDLPGTATPGPVSRSQLVGKMETFFKKHLNNAVFPPRTAGRVLLFSNHQTEKQRA